MVNKVTQGKVLKLHDMHVRLTIRAAVYGDCVVNNVGLDAHPLRLTITSRSILTNVELLSQIIRV